MPAGKSDHRLQYNLAVIFANIFGYNGFVFRQAKQAARRSGKPLLNAGCKRRYTHLSDVNLDIAPRNVPHFVRGDVQSMTMFADKQFGAAYAAHLLEHVGDPDAALRELHRVAENVFIITPLLIYPWSWLHREHKWVLWGSKKVCRIPRFHRNGHGPR